MIIPRTLLRHRLTVERALGSTSVGDTFGPEEIIPAYVEAKRSRVSDREGKELIATADCWVRPSDELNPGDRVTFRGDSWKVLSVKLAEWQAGVAAHLVKLGPQ